MSDHRTAFAPVLLGTALAIAPAWGWGQQAGTFPDRPVRLLYSASPGGALDFISRNLSSGLSSIWGRPVVVENKPGASGLIKAEMLAKSPPDGHTLGMVGDATMVVIPHLYDKMPYDTLTDLVPIGLVGSVPLMLVASSTLKVNTVADLVQIARSRPGTIDYASNGIGSTHHISTEVLQERANIRLNHIPFKGGAQSVQEVLAGRIPVTFVAISTAAPLFNDNRLVKLGVGTSSRSPRLPDTPTIAEQGYPNFESATWVGVIAPKGMSTALVQRINGDLEKVTRSAAYRDALVSGGNEVRHSSPQEFAERIRTEYERNRSFIKNSVSSK